MLFERITCGQVSKINSLPTPKSMLPWQGLHLKRPCGFLRWEMGLYFIIDQVTCRENEKCVTLTPFPFKWHLFTMTFLITDLFFPSVTPAASHVQVQGCRVPLMLAFGELLAQLRLGGRRALKHGHQSVFQRNSSGMEISSRQLCRGCGPGHTAQRRNR